MRTKMLGKLCVAVAVVLVASSAAGVRATEEYSGPYFGDGNLPPGCTGDHSIDNPDNVCHRMRVAMNGLDSPQVDVAVLVPASPTAERDMRVMRQAIDMWEGGIDLLARRMGLDWLADGMDFHVAVDYVDPLAGQGGEFTTYPIVDPEIVVVATNPIGGGGIGVDPLSYTNNENKAPCHGIQNPLDFDYWENLPGFDSHHDSRGGTYVEDCGGAGGDICFAVNTGLDPAVEIIDLSSLFELVAHEVGHCLTIGHVGDAGDGTWGVAPTTDIMSYNDEPADRTTCVSTLDVEGVATRMSRYLDVDGDGDVDAADRRDPNETEAPARQLRFQVQHPGSHFYASATGSPLDCPQPDIGLVPGPRTDWTPTAVAVAPPASSAGSHDDADDDATTPFTEIERLDVNVTATHVEATLQLAEVWPNTSVSSGASYGLVVDGRDFESFTYTPHGTAPMTWDSSSRAYLGEGTSTWDLDADTVTFRIPRAYLSANHVTAPYRVYGRTRLGVNVHRTDDFAPERGRDIAVAG